MPSVFWNLGGLGEFGEIIIFPDRGVVILGGTVPSVPSSEL